MTGLQSLRFIVVAMVCLCAPLLPATGPARALETGLSTDLEDALRQPFHGDFDELVSRGYIRILVPFSRTFYFLDNGVQRGTTVDLMAEFGKFLDKRHGQKVRDGQLVIVPTRRDKLFSDLAEGRGDIALGNLTVTPERQELAAFSSPLYDKAREVPVTAAGVGDLTSPEDLAGMEIHVRRSSSYYDSLLALNETLKAAGKAPVTIVDADENLEDEDLLELVQAGGIPMVIVDEHKAAFWLEILDGLKFHDKAAVRDHGVIAIAVRKDAPELLKEVSAFAETAKKGTLLGNIILKRYLKDATYLKDLNSDDRKTKFETLSALFRKYGQDFSVDWLLIAAQSYQESQFNQDVRSGAGAVGLMQIKPSTAAGTPIEITGVAEDADKNVQAGVKYLRYIADTYFADLKDDAANQTFFALAAYNAGPSRFDTIRKEAEKRGLDPDIWFGNVEWVVADKVSREPVRYVGNIYKYYVVFGEEADRRQREAEPAAAPAKSE